MEGVGRTFSISTKSKNGSPASPPIPGWTPQSNRTVFPLYSSLTHERPTSLPAPSGISSTCRTRVNNPQIRIVNTYWIQMSESHSKFGTKRGTRGSELHLRVAVHTVSLLMPGGGRGAGLSAGLFPEGPGAAMLATL